jgi:N-acetyl-gamma-glutamyl-phosphate reductase
LAAINVAILGASGYTGSELIRLISNHPYFRVSLLTAHSESGKDLNEVHPHLHSTLPLKNFHEVKDQLLEVPLIFSCLPHQASLTVLEELLESGYAGKIIDLSNDARLNPKWQYGLPELFHEGIVNSKLVANPGCFATAIALGVAPLIAANLFEKLPIIANALSGASGAGKTLNSQFHFANLYESAFAYKIGTHQHVPEIEQSFSRLNSNFPPLLFTPHVVPMSRGILATTTIFLKTKSSLPELHEVFDTFYKESPFVSRTLVPPSTKEVRGSNLCKIHLNFNERTQSVVIISVIDNLIKGASGQAIQNGNLLFNFSEESGLSKLGLFP